MILITGGAWQGKLKFAMELAECMRMEAGKVAEGKTDGFEAVLDRPIIHDFHEYIKRLLKECKSPEAFVDEIERNNPNVIIITNELGCGIVPIDPNEREWREAAGRAAVRLAGASERVYRLVCGIPTKIK